MGVSTEVFTFYGVKLEWDEAFAEAFDDHYESLEDIVIIDGMGGNYIVIGSKLFESGDSRWEAMSGFGEVDISDLPDEKANATEKFIEHMPAFADRLDGEWKLMTFVHYS